MKTDHAVRDVTCDNFVATQSYVVPNATGRKYYIRQNSTCSTPNVVNMTYCKKARFWVHKPRLRYHKSHTKKNVRYSKIAAHFIDDCCDGKYLSTI